MLLARLGLLLLLCLLLHWLLLLLLLLLLLPRFSRLPASSATPATPLSTPVLALSASLPTLTLLLLLLHVFDRVDSRLLLRKLVQKFHVGCIAVLAENVLELQSDVAEVVGVDESAAVVLAEPVEVRAT